VIAVAVRTISFSGQREILEALLTWDGAGLPSEVDWLVHEHADRAAHFGVIALGVDPRLSEAAASAAPWDANACGSLQWNCNAERRVAEQLQLLATTEE
jgi:hypothetical protein